MARAKRTDRAEARARYRAYLAAQYPADDQDAEDYQVVESPSRAGSAARAGRTVGASAGSSAGSSAVPGARPGFLGSFKSATRPIHYFDDLRYAPTLILKTKAIWPAALITIAGTAYGLTLNNFKDPAVGILLATLLAMPPMFQPILSGFLAPRATWLAGIISGLIAGAGFLIVLAWWRSGHMTNLPADFNAIAEQYTPAQVALSAVALGALLGAGAGWYKRFLQGTMGRNQTAQQRSAAQRARQKTARKSTGR